MHGVLGRPAPFFTPHRPAQRGPKVTSESSTPESPDSAGSLLRTGLSRRGVVRTALWSVPAVTVAPAYASSTTSQLTYDPDSGLGWGTLDDYPETGESLTAAVGAIAFSTSSQTVQTPALRMTIDFPSNWTAGGNTVFVAPNPEAASWADLHWVPDDALTNGRLSSASGTFDFTYSGGETTDFIGIPFIAWSAADNLSSQDTPVTATLQILNPSDPPAWEISGGTAFAVPVNPIPSGSV